MRPVLKLTSVVVVASCLFIASLFSIWAAPPNDQSIPRLLPTASRPNLIQSSQAITFTPVATIYLPLVTQAGAAPPVCNTPGTPSLVSPGNGTTINDTTPTFDWNNASDSSEYQLQVDNNANFSSPEIDIATASSDYTPASGLSDGTYSWRVRGHNTSSGCDEYGSWSSVWSVIIDTTSEPGLLFDNVLHLDGIDDYAVAPDSSNLDMGDEPSESFTLEAWFLADDVHPSSAQFVLIADKSGSYALLVELLSLSNCLEWRVFGDPGISFRRTCSKDLITSGWHHVALVFDNTADQLSLYLDGQRVGSPSPFTDLVLNSTGEFHVGGLSEGNWFAGRIEEVRLSDSVRYTGETYTIPGPFAFVCDEQTRALWHFDEPSGATTMYDGEDGNGSDCGGIEDTLTGVNGATTGPDTPSR